MTAGVSYAAQYQREYLDALVAAGAPVEAVTNGYPRWAQERRTWSKRRPTPQECLRDAAKAQRKARAAGTLHYVGEGQSAQVHIDPAYRRRVQPWLGRTAA